MPISQRLMGLRKLTGPVWEWGKPFNIEDKVTMAATAIAMSASTFFDTPLDGGSGTQTVPMDVTNAATSVVVMFDTPLDGGPGFTPITMDAHTIATRASVVLV